MLITTTANGKPERVAVYARVSSDEQAEAGTIQNQLDFARRYTDLHGLMVHDYYSDDGVSGTIAVDQRPEGKRLMADVRAAKFDTTLVYRVDRFARSTLHLLNAHEDMKKAGVALRSMTEPFDTSTPLGEFVMTLLGSLAALERSTILERTALGRLRAARDGRWLGGKPPFGYWVVDKRLAVEPSEADVVRRIFKLYVEDGKGLIPVADLLNAEGVPSPYEHRGLKTERWPERERVWNTGTLSRILRCTAYIGHYHVGERAGKDIAEYETAPIVDQETFDEAQRLLKERFVEASRNARRFYLLRGLIKCHCGRVVVGGGNLAKGRFYYLCPNGHFRQRAEVLEESIWRDVAAFAWDPGDIMARLRERLQGQARETEDVSAELAEVGRQIVGRKTEQDNVITLYRKGRITEAQLDTQLDALSRDAATLEARQQELFAHQARAQAQEVALLSAEETLAQLRGRVTQIEQDSASEDATVRDRALQDKRDLFKGLIADIALDEAGNLNVRYHFSSAHASARTEQNDTLTLESTLTLTSTTETAARLGVSRSYVSRLARAGTLPAMRPGTDRYYIPSDATLPERRCRQCGAPLVDVALSRVYCDGCRTKRKREAESRYWERRKAGKVV